MKRISKIEIKETTEELRKIYQSTNNPRIKLKVKSLILFKENVLWKQERIAEHLCISLATLKRWLKEYNQKGLSFLMTVKSKGKPKSVIDNEIQIALQKLLAESPQAFRSYSDVKWWIYETFKVEIKYATVRSFMIKQFKTRIRRTKSSSFIRGGKAVS